MIFTNSSKIQISTITWRIELNVTTPTISTLIPEIAKIICPKKLKIIPSRPFVRDAFGLFIIIWKASCNAYYSVQWLSKIPIWNCTIHHHCLELSHNPLKPPVRSSSPADWESSLPLHSFHQVALFVPVLQYSLTTELQPDH